MECIIRAIKSEKRPGVYEYNVTINDQTLLALSAMQVVKLNNVLHEIQGNSNSEVVYKFVDTTQ